jgi:DNA polymerase|nr:MAG TPA: DNA polymerase I [Caudoviricetes sp.]
MTKFPFLLMDFETFSTVDIGKCGSYRYMDDPSFEPLLLSYAMNDDPVKLVDFTHDEEWPEEFLAALYDPAITKIAWNCAFERNVIYTALGKYTPPEQWLDVMHVAAQCGLPMSLDAAGKALGLPEEQAKMKEGKALIRYFCCPCKPTKTNGGRERNLPEHAPERWKTFRDYCTRDTEAERTIFHMLEQWLPNEDERRFWALDQRINERGVRIDRQLAINAVAMDERYKEELTAKAVALTGLENPKSVSQVKNWLADQEGKSFPSLNKKVIADVVSQLQSEDAREFMALRGELSKSSTAKYQAMLRSMCSDEHSKGCFQFYGANRTGRFAGRLVQFQNMSKNYSPSLAGMRELVRGGHYSALNVLYDSVSGVLSELVRTAIIPEEGQRIVVADFSAIEARVTAWFAGEEWRLQTFRDGGDIYCASASQMFHVPVVKHGINGELRQKGKVAELALGYGGGVNALKAFGADKMGMSDEEMQETVDLWRESSPKIVELWRQLEKAAIRCVARRATTTSTLGNVRFDFESGILWMTLPSGRRLAYYGAKYEETKFHPGRKSLTYMGVNQMTKRWERVETWGGKLTENCWAAGTPVLTARGWTPIEEVTPDDLVWDGVEWVENDGSECQHSEKILCRLDGLLVTEDHKILTTEGWKDAKDCDGLERLPIQLPEGYGTGGDPRLTRTEKVARAMRLWRDEGNGHSRPSSTAETRAGGVLRMQEGRADLTSPAKTRDDKVPRLRRVALNDSAVHRADASSVEELRGPRYHGLREMAARLRRLLERHGADVSARAGHRPEGKRKGLLPRELPLGNAQSKLSKQTEHANYNVPWADRDGEKSLGAIGHQIHHAPVPAEPRLSVRATTRRAGHGTPVYDVMNCGPRHRYVVLGESGPIVAHNCVQATARDVLREAMFSLTEKGWDIRAHVHDECICTEPIGGKTVEQMCKAMCPDIPWAEGLPLNADGYDGPYYFKD